MPDVAIQADRGSHPVVVWLGKGAVGGHAGVAYAASDDGESQFLHLRFHHELMNEAALKLAAVYVTPLVSADDLADVATVIRRVAERHRDGGVPYALMKRGTSILDGQIDLGASLGLTCATLVLVLFEAANVRLIVDTSWERRSETRKAEDIGLACSMLEGVPRTAATARPSSLLAVLALGCSTPSPPHPAVEVTLKQASATTPASAGLPRPTAPSSLEGWTMQERVVPRLGDPCERNPARQQPRASSLGPPASIDPVCGTANRVSMEVWYTAFRTSDPAPPCELDQLPVDASNQSYVRRLCVSGDHMLLESACIACRVLDAGTIAHVRLSELTPEQHESLGSTMMFEPGRGPRTPDEWRGLAKGAQRR